MAVLPTNYLDDILAQSMNGKRKFRITHPDGTFEEVIIEDISEYSQTGSTFGAGDINRTNQAVNEKLDSADVVDPALATVLGFAADAKLTGDSLSELNKNKADITYFSANNENLTGEIWAGKPVYAKIIDFGELLIVGTNEKEIDTSNMDTFWVDTAHSFVTNNVNIYPVPYLNISNMNSGNIQVFINQNKCKIVTGESWIGYVAYVTIKYTKK